MWLRLWPTAHSITMGLRAGWIQLLCVNRLCGQSGFPQLCQW